MKVSELLEGKAVKQTAASASAHYEKLKGWLEKGLNNVTQRMVDGAKAHADSLWNDEFKASEKDLIDKHGADWWELAKKQYPAKQENGMWVVRSNFALDPDSGKRGPWEFPGQWQAMDKVVQLVKWLDGGRKKGYGDKNVDVQKWFDRLDAVDLNKAAVATVGEAVHRVPAGTMIPRVVKPQPEKKPGDEGYDWRNPNHNPSGKKHVRPKNTSKMPVIDDEFGRRLFDVDLVDHLKDEYGLDVWRKMSELDQIKAQFSFVSPPPKGGKTGFEREDEAALDRRARKMQSIIHKQKGESK